MPVHDNYNLKSHKYVCITKDQPDTKSNPNPNPNPTTKQHAIVNTQLNIVTMYPDKFTRDMLSHTTSGCNCHTAILMRLILHDSVAHPSVL